MDYNILDFISTNGTLYDGINPYTGQTNTDYYYFDFKTVGINSHFFNYNGPYQLDISYVVVGGGGGGGNSHFVVTGGYQYSNCGGGGGGANFSQGSYSLLSNSNLNISVGNGGSNVSYDVSQNAFQAGYSSIKFTNLVEVKSLGGFNGGGGGKGDNSSSPRGKGGKEANGVYVGGNYLYDFVSIYKIYIGGGGAGSSANGGDAIYSSYSGGTGGAGNTISFLDGSNMTICSGGKGGDFTGTIPTPLNSEYGGGGLGGGFDSSGTLTDGSDGTQGFVLIYFNKRQINALTNIGNTLINGTCSSTQFITTSDYRIKENVETLDEEDLQNIDKMNPVKYYNGISKTIDYGFIAHEIEEYYKIFVEGGKDEKSFQKINYTQMVPLLTKKIQVLRENNSKLKKELKDICEFV